MKRILDIFLVIFRIVKINTYFDGAVRRFVVRTSEIPHDEKNFQIVKNIIYQNAIDFFIFVRVFEKTKCVQFTD